MGFTCGIAVTILASQLKDLGGLQAGRRRAGPAVRQAGGSGARLADRQPARLWPGRRPLPRSSPASGACRPLWPAMLIAVAARLGSRPMSCTCRSRPSAAASAASRTACRVPQLPPISRAPDPGTSCPRRSSFTLLGGDREPALGQGRRRHDRPQAPLEHGADRPGDRQHRLGPVRRDQRDRDHRAHRDQCARRRRAARWPACCTRSSCWSSCVVAAPLASFVPLAALAGVLVRGVLEHGREARRSRGCCATGAPRAVLLATFGLTLVARPDHRHPRGLPAGGDPLGTADLARPRTTSPADATAIEAWPQGV